MTLRGAALLVHVVLAIGLVGGSSWAHVAGHRVRRARSVAAARAHAEGLLVFNRAAVPLTLGTVGAGTYVATVDGTWSQPWLLVSLVLLALVGSLSAAVVDPATSALVEALDEAPAGSVPPDVVLLSHAPGVAAVPSVFAGIDLGIVLLVTSRPGPGRTAVVAAAALAVGGVLALRERRQMAWTA